ncbi:MAG TPA: aminoglycoside phosphotransferase family protein [Chlamydiales bacterium]|nr:aminoglycoside phosphotransferase family protein [Chlamydiales bacterium]
MKIDDNLVRRLIASQFPQWKDLSVSPVARSGWDNRTFHLGEEMLVRMPSAARYANQVEKEHDWLPRLAPLLPLQIPRPLAMGEPGEGYPWKWSVYCWIEGEPAASAEIANLNDFATLLAQFLIALHSIDSTNGPLPGPHNFYRGGPLAIYDGETRRAFAILKDKMDIETATDLWESALSTQWAKRPVWIHGDMSAGNLLVREGQLRGIIDFGQLGIGDPACDLAITWTLFKDESRKIFRSLLPLDADTWMRGRAWTLWKALIYIVDDLTNMNFEAARSWQIIDEILTDHKSEK